MSYTIDTRAYIAHTNIQGKLSHFVAIKKKLILELCESAWHVFVYISMNIKLTLRIQ